MRERLIDWYSREVSDDVREVPILLYLIKQIKIPRSELLLEKRKEFNDLKGEDEYIFRIIWIQLYRWRKYQIDDSRYRLDPEYRRSPITDWYEISPLWWHFAKE